MKNLNLPTKEQTERLAILIEECAEVQQIACKILRHGYTSAHPAGGPINMCLLEKELGDLKVALYLLLNATDVNERAINYHYAKKLDSIMTYTHFQ